MKLGSRRGSCSLMVAISHRHGGQDDACDHEHKPGKGGAEGEPHLQLWQNLTNVNAFAWKKEINNGLLSSPPNFANVPRPLKMNALD